MNKADPEQIQDFLSVLQYEYHQKDSVLMREGDKSNNKIYILMSGTTSVYKKDYVDVFKSNILNQQQDNNENAKSNDKSPLKKLFLKIPQKKERKHSDQITVANSKSRRKKTLESDEEFEAEVTVETLQTLLNIETPKNAANQKEQDQQQLQQKHQQQQLQQQQQQVQSQVKTQKQQILHQQDQKQKPKVFKKALAGFSKNLMKAINNSSCQHLDEDEPNSEFYRQFGKKVNSLSQGAIIGELAVLEKDVKKQYRTATLLINSLEGAEFFVIHQRQFTQIIKQLDDVSMRKTRFLMKYVPCLEIINSSKILQELLYYFESESYPLNSKITEEEQIDQHQSLYFLVEGKCSVFKSFEIFENDPPVQIHVCDIERGALIGEEILDIPLNAQHILDQMSSTNLKKRPYTYTVQVVSSEITVFKLQKKYLLRKFPYETIKSLLQIYYKKKQYRKKITDNLLETKYKLIQAEHISQNQQKQEKYQQEITEQQLNNSLHNNMKSLEIEQNQKKFHISQKVNSPEQYNQLLQAQHFYKDSNQKGAKTHLKHQEEDHYRKIYPDFQFISSQISEMELLQRFKRNLKVQKLQNLIFYKEAVVDQKSKLSLTERLQQKKLLKSSPVKDLIDFFYDGRSKNQYHTKEIEKQILSSSLHSAYVNDSDLSESKSYMMNTPANGQPLAPITEENNYNNNQNHEQDSLNLKKDSIIQQSNSQPEENIMQRSVIFSPHQNPRLSKQPKLSCHQSLTHLNSYRSLPHSLDQSPNNKEQTTQNAEKSSFKNLIIQTKLHNQQKKHQKSKSTHLFSPEVTRTSLKETELPNQMMQMYKSKKSQLAKSDSQNISISTSFNPIPFISPTNKQQQQQQQMPKTSKFSKINNNQQLGINNQFSLKDLAQKQILSPTLLQEKQQQFSLPFFKPRPISHHKSSNSQHIFKISQNQKQKMAFKSQTTLNTPRVPETNNNKNKENKDDNNNQNLSPKTTYNVKPEYNSPQKMSMSQKLSKNNKSYTINISKKEQDTTGIFKGKSNETNKLLNSSSYSSQMFQSIALSPIQTPVNRLRNQNQKINKFDYQSKNISQSNQTAQQNNLQNPYLLHSSPYMKLNSPLNSVRTDKNSKLLGSFQSQQNSPRTHYNLKEEDKILVGEESQKVHRMVSKAKQMVKDKKIQALNILKNNNCEINNKPTANQEQNGYLFNSPNRMICPKTVEIIPSRQEEIEIRLELERKIQKQKQFDKQIEKLDPVQIQGNLNTFIRKQENCIKKQEKSILNQMRKKAEFEIEQYKINPKKLQKSPRNMNLSSSRGSNKKPMDIQKSSDSADFYDTQYQFNFVNKPYEKYL